MSALNFIRYKQHLKNNKTTRYLLEMVAVQINFSYPIISELMTWNLHELVVFQIMFLYFKTMICIHIIYILWKLYEFGYIFRLFRYLKKSEQITRILYDLVAFAFDSFALKYYGIYNHRTHDIKFVWFGCISKMIFVSLTIMIYIYIHIISELMTWNLHELVAFQIMFVF